MKHDTPHEWADSMADWAVANPSPAPRVPRVTQPVCQPLEAASACTEIGADTNGTKRAASPLVNVALIAVGFVLFSVMSRPVITVSAVMFLALCAGVQQAFGG